MTETSLIEPGKPGDGRSYIRTIEPTPEAELASILEKDARCATEVARRTGKREEWRSAAASWMPFDP